MYWIAVVNSEQTNIQDIKHFKDKNKLFDWAYKLVLEDNPTASKEVVVNALEFDEHYVFPHYPETALACGEVFVQDE